MLSYISVVVENNQYRGGIEIKSTASTTNIKNIGYVNISRKGSKDSSIVDIATIPVVSVDDLTFSIFDLGSKSKEEYVYYIDVCQKNGTVIEAETYFNIKCNFEGLFVGNSTAQYIAGTNFKTETKRNTHVEYVTTLAGRYPYRISNSDSNYTTGSSNGLFLELTEDKKRFIPDYDHSFSDKVLNFIADGRDKVVKTHDGQAWLVSIDASPSKIYSDYTGMNAISFNWTEIGELASVKAVID